MHRNVRSFAQSSMARTFLLAVVLAALCGVALNSPASQAAAAEKTPAPLGVAGNGSPCAGVQFADRKFGIDDSAFAGKTLASVAAPRQTDGMAVPETYEPEPQMAEAEPLWQEPVEDDDATFGLGGGPPPDRRHGRARDL